MNKRVLLLILIAMMGCEPKVDDFGPSAFSADLRLNGTLPFKQSVNDVSSRLGKPDSIVNSSGRYYYHDLEYLKFDDFLHLRKINFGINSKNFITTGKLKLDSSTRINEVKAYHTIDFNTELDDNEKAKYQLIGISATVKTAYDFWMLKFDRKTSRLVQMEYMLFD